MSYKETMQQAVQQIISTDDNESDLSANTKASIALGSLLGYVAKIGDDVMSPVRWSMSADRFVRKVIADINEEFPMDTTEALKYAKEVFSARVLVGEANTIEAEAAINSLGFVNGALKVFGSGSFGLMASLQQHV